MTQPPKGGPAPGAMWARVPERAPPTLTTAYTWTSTRFPCVARNGDAHRSGADPPQQLRTAAIGRRLPRFKKQPIKEPSLTMPAPSISELEKRVRELILMQGQHPDEDLIGDIMMTALRMVRDGTTRGELKILAATLRELRYAFNIFRPFRDRRKITIFGSARTPADAPEYLAAKRFGELMVRDTFKVITGAGAGSMEAAQGGAGRDYSFGVNIKLPFEQSANPYIEGDKKLINFRYFFTRKLCFVKEASAIALFPGGFGTHDECYETLTLVQTGKAAIVPIVFVDKPGGRYWRDWADYVVNHLLANKLISEEDMNLFKITDDVEWAANEVLSFYRRYHSSRFVKDTLVIRMLTPLPEGTLERLNDMFARNAGRPEERQEQDCGNRATSRGGVRNRTAAPAPHRLQLQPPELWTAAAVD